MTNYRNPLLLAAALFLATTAATAAPVTDVRLQNTATAAQTAVPITFGQVFAVGDVKQSDVLVGSLAGAAVPLQVDVKATHADGSVRHAVISAVVPQLPAGTTTMAISTGGAASSATTADYRDAGTTAKLTLNIEGVKYTATLADAMAATPVPWLAGPVAAEVFAGAPLKDAAGVVHPMLTARFGVRWYPAAKATRIEVVVENSKAFTAARNFTYDVNLDVDGKSVYVKPALTHFNHSRWHSYVWVNVQPAVNVQLNTAYLIASKAVSNYDQSIVIPDANLNGWAQTLTPANTGPMTIGTVVPYMGMTGGRGDIGPLPDYSVAYLLSMDKRVRDVVFANADGSGTWPIHYRDENTGYPIRTDSEVNAQVSLHPNMQWYGPLPVPRTVPGAPVGSQYEPDVAHHPSLDYLPYLITGDYYYLEELHFWAATNPLGTAPGYNGYGKGLLRWHQIRGQAWGLRTLGHAAYITPDADPMKAYFLKQLDANLDFYNQTYVVGNPNKLGAYDGSGEASMEAPASAPWQDDFLTWSFGYLSELGFTKAQPILEWKAKYSIGRMTDPGFCWISASAYTLQYRDSPSSPVYDSFAKLYQVNFGGDVIRSDPGDYVPGPAGVKYIDLPCGSQAQADYLNAINKNYGWPVGKMMGYSDNTLGYTANMQPGLSVAVSTTNPNAAKAWNVFVNRGAKPDYRANPQWNIIPRTINGVAYVLPTTSSPVTPSTTPTPAATSPLPSPFKVGSAPKMAGDWTLVGAEHATVTVPDNSIVRYGLNGAYVYGTISGRFEVTNDTFGRDPVVGVGKIVEQFTPTVAPPAAAVVKPGTIVTPGTAAVAKKKGLRYRVFDPATGVLVKEFTGVTPSSANKFTLTDVALIPGATGLAGAVIDPSTGLPLAVQYPLTVK